METFENPNFGPPKPCLKEIVKTADGGWFNPPFLLILLAIDEDRDEYERLKIKISDGEVWTGRGLVEGSAIHVLKELSPGPKMIKVVDYSLSLSSQTKHWSFVLLEVEVGEELEFGHFGREIETLEEWAAEERRLRRIHRWMANILRVGVIVFAIVATLLVKLVFLPTEIALKQNITVVAIVHFICNAIYYYWIYPENNPYRPPKRILF